MASKNFSLQKLTHPLLNEGGSSDGLADREILAKTGGAEAPPSEPPKTGGRNDEAAGSAGKLRLSSQNLLGLLNPATSFFGVGLREL
jgi:hypothetical protein